MSVVVDNPGFMSAKLLRAAVNKANAGKHVVLWMAWVDHIENEIVGFKLDNNSTFSISSGDYLLRGYSALNTQKHRLVGNMRYNPATEGVFDNFWRCWAYMQRKRQKLSSTK